MRFELNDFKRNPGVDQFQTDWIGLTIEENGLIFGKGGAKISSAQLLMINCFCGLDKAYANSNDMVISTFGNPQGELEALIRARGRALAMMFQEQVANGQPIG